MLLSKSVVDDMVVLAQFEIQVAQFWRSSQKRRLRAFTYCAGEIPARAQPFFVPPAAELHG